MHAVLRLSAVLLVCTEAAAAVAASKRVLGGSSRGRSALLLRGGAGEQQLSQSDMFSFEEAMPWLRYVRVHGVLQFISIFHELKNLTSDELLWGDEIEYHLVHVDEAAKR
eukprot:651055-Prymnesium_polylepis.1